MILIIDLAGFENSYLKLSENMAPAYLYVSNDIGQQLADIDVLEGN